MKRLFRMRAPAIAMAAVAFLQALAIGQTSERSPQPSSRPDAARSLVNTYCVTCHNSRAKTGGLALDGLDLQDVAKDARIWETVLRKLRGHLMPPPGLPQPPQKDVDSFVAWMENSLDSHAAGPTAGYVPIQRLNRTEYAASVSALVGVDVKAQEVLPQDVQVEGFDNIASALNVSPAFLDQYITAARQIAKLAVGDRNARVSSVKYSVATNQEPQLSLPLGTRGGVGFTHRFPVDGEYRINVLNLSLGLYTSNLESVNTVVIMIDGKIAFRQPIGGPADQALVDRQGAGGRAKIMERFSKIPVHVQAGVHDVVVAFIERARVESSENITPPPGPGGFGFDRARTSRLVDGIEILGPYNAAGISQTTSRALIFVCDPKKNGEPACAKQITENLARRAFRRPATADDVTRLMPFYETERAQGRSFDQGIEQVVAAVLASPEFLFRAIRGSSGASPSVEFPLSDLELASRLSFFLWNTGPDDELLTLATAGGLTKAGALEKQARRMLADPKASSLVTSFAMKWLNLLDLDSVDPDPALFSGFSIQLRQDFSKEAERFVSSIFSEDRSVVELLTSNRTFVNERLARHYGISGVLGSQFREITLEDKSRFGLLGKAAILMKTSYPDRTSPVLRGAWVLDKLVGAPPSPPPPNAASNLAQVPGEKPKTVRARLEQHRDQPTCRQCHGVIDPTGLALENFDAIGQWRNTDRHAENAAIDASTVLPNGVAINGPVELRAQLADRPATFVRAFAEKLMMYALNRQLEYIDMPQIRAIVRAAAKDNYKFSSIVLGIVSSDAFRKQAPQVIAKENVVQSASAR
jgi:mono/diheme cytochrome c family protein